MSIEPCQNTGTESPSSEPTLMAPSFLVGVSAVHVAMALVLLVLLGQRLRWFAFLRRR